MKTDNFMCRIDTISEMKALILRLSQCVYDIDHHGYLSPEKHLIAYDELTKASQEVYGILDQLKNNLSVFPIVPPKFRLEIRSIVNRAERLLREHELLD